jgi:hypothetical protein
MSQNAVNTAAASFVSITASLEDWAMEAAEMADITDTAHAIVNAAREALEAGAALWAAYADGYAVDTNTLRIQINTLRAMVVWAAGLAA